MASVRPDFRWPAKARAPVAFCLAGAAAGAALYFGNLAYISSTASVPAAASAPAVTSPASLALPTVAEKIPVGQSPSHVQVAPNGKFAYVVNPGAGAIDVISTATDKLSGTIKIPQGPPQFVSFSPDSRTAYVSVYSRGVELVVFVDTATGAVTGTVRVNNITPGHSTTSPDGRYLYVTNDNAVQGNPGDNVIDVIDTASRKLVDSFPVAPNPQWIVFGNNGLFYVTDLLSTVVTVFNAQNNRVIGEIEVGETPYGIAISPDGSTLAITSYDGNEVFLVSTATDQEVAVIPVGREPLELTYSPDGRYIYTVDSEDNTVTVIDTADNKVIGVVPTGKSPTSISVLPDGRQAYVADENDGTIEVLNIPR